jgi:alkanesulfonate monooxygenase SsuD/methylene tetrahydromethanopterin reductase-like flavin-dependent oxidoreductase (luciferase family)
VLSGGR